MGHVCYGRAFETMIKEDYRYILKVFKDGALGLITAYDDNLIRMVKTLTRGQIGHMPTLLKFRLHGLVFRDLIKGLDKYESYCQTQTQKRMNKIAAVDNRDIFSYLLEAKDPETNEGFTKLELISESSLLINAGK